MKRIKKYLKEYKAWLVESEQADLAVDIKIFNGNLQSDSPAKLILLSNSAKSFAYSKAKKGLVTIQEKNEQGWSDLGLSMLCFYWSTKLACARPYAGSLTLYLHKTASLLAVFIAAKQDKLAADTAKFLTDMIIIKDLIGFKWLEGGKAQVRMFEPFMLWLYLTSQNKPLPDRLKPGNWGIYQKVIDHWHQPEELAPILLALCDYHCQQMKDNGKDWYAEFQDPPFDLLPSEIVAIYQVREQLGLDTPKVQHPLLDTPMVALDKLVFDEDEIIQQISAAYEQFMAG